MQARRSQQAVRRPIATGGLSLLLLLACTQRAGFTVARDAAPEAVVTIHDAASDPFQLPSTRDGAQSQSDSPMTGRFCGNGSKERDEECDDGNTVSGDGCSSVCRLEPCRTCPPPPKCGDGRIMVGEICDDGNTKSGDGCAADCQTVEPGWRCRVQSLLCTPVCGDGVLTGSETCDDGNTLPGDGCSAYCLTEPGWSCANGDCTRTALDGGSDGGASVLFCGDGIRSGAEECDWGPKNNDSDYGSCTTGCLMGNFCGDGEVNAPEACDLGPRNGSDLSPAGCTAGCTRPHYCGDGFVDEEEQCDLGDLNGKRLDRELKPTDSEDGLVYCWIGCEIPPSIRWDRRSAP